MNRAFFAGNIALLSLLIACSGSAKVTQGNEASASVYKPNNLSSASAEISASTGGYINVGKAQLRIPAQALEADTTITAEVADITLPEGGAKAIGKGIRLKPEGLQFLKPAELMLCYSSTEAANLNASGAKIYYHTEDNQYVAIAGNADLSTSCVTSHIEHFSSYVAAAYSQLPGNTAPVIGGANFLPTTPLAGIPLRVRTAIDDVNGSTPIGTTVPGTVVTAFFYYRTVGSPTFTKVALQPDTTDDTVTNRYFFQIPGSEVTTGGIEYYFEATDNLNVTRRVPTAAGSFSTRTVPTAATGIRLNPTGSVNISAGFSRAFTLQATDNGTTWQNISADNFSLTNSSLGTALRTGPSTVRFNAVGAGTGQLTSTIGALSAGTTVNVVPGLLTHIELTDTNQVALAGSLELPVSQVYNFDVVGYDSYGNVAQVYPAFTTTGGIGSVVVDVTGAHFTPAATVGSGSLLADLAGLTDTLSISLYVPPQVTATAPFDQTPGIALNASVGVSFSHVMDTSTLTTTTTSACVGSLQVSSDNFATCVAMASATPTFHASNTLAVIQPAANLAGTTTYKIRVTTAARNTGGYSIAQVYTTPTGFTTVAAPPVVVGIVPTNGATNIPVNSGVSITFSLAMDPGTLTTSTTTACSGSIQVSKSVDNFSTCVAMAGLVTLSNGAKTATLTPLASFANDTQYKVRITTEARSSLGLAIAADYEQVSGWSTESAGALLPIRVYGQWGNFSSIGPNNNGPGQNPIPNNNGLFHPTAIAADSTGVYIADFSVGSRILYYSGTSTTASRIYTGFGAISGMIADNNGLYVADLVGNRVLFFSGSSTVPSRVYGQLGSFSTLVANQGGLSADSLNNPAGVGVDATGVYIADYGNNRVLYYPGTSTTAIRVYGQSDDFFTNQQNKGGIGAGSLASPRAVASNGAGVYIADTVNHRVLYYSGTSTTASRVYGQYGNFSTSTPDLNGISADSLRDPWALVADANGFYVSEFNNSRILYFTGISTTAIRQYGHINFSIVGCNVSYPFAGGLCEPAGLAVDPDGKMYVADYANNRALTYP